LKRFRAERLLHQKLVSASGLIHAISVWRVPRSERYPEGLRYRLALVDSKTGSVLLLFDNHWPKGHHVHRGTKEHPHPFVSLEHLVREFRKESDEIEGRRDEDKTNPNQNEE